MKKNNEEQLAFTKGEQEQLENESFDDVKERFSQYEEWQRESLTPTFLF